MCTLTHGDQRTTCRNLSSSTTWVLGPNSSGQAWRQAPFTLTHLSSTQHLFLFH